MIDQTPLPNISWSMRLKKEKKRNSTVCCADLVPKFRPLVRDYATPRAVYHTLFNERATASAIPIVCSIERGRNYALRQPKTLS